jgi:hypothetical protein
VDTEGDVLPEDVASFPVLGDFSDERIEKFKMLAVSDNIKCTMFDAGDARAGEIQVTHRAPSIMNILLTLIKTTYPLSSSAHWHTN